MPLEPAQTRPRSNFPESRAAFSKVRSAELNTDGTILMPGTDYFGETAVKQVINITYTQHQQESHNPAHDFAALIRLSTTSHNLLTFNISEISSNNSDNLSLLANKHLWTFLSHSSYPSFRM